MPQIIVKKITILIQELSFWIKSASGRQKLTIGFITISSRNRERSAFLNYLNEIDSCI